MCKPFCCTASMCYCRSLTNLGWDLSAQKEPAPVKFYHLNYNLAVILCKMTRACTVHKNTDVCVSSQLSRVKIAIAFALIRIKPANQNVREFITNLQSFYHDKVSSFYSSYLKTNCVLRWNLRYVNGLLFYRQENRWKSEYFRLKNEMLQVRQHQVLSGLKETTLVTLTSAG